MQTPTLSVHLLQLGKRFKHRWLFSQLNLSVHPPGLAILGPNGSGKSTLLQIISGFVVPSEGTVEWRISDKVIPASELHKFLSLSTPYLDIIEEFTFLELIRFQQTFKPLLPPLNPSDVLRLSGLSDFSETPLSDFSSGMKQRAKLSLALLSDTPAVLLDEPCANLDASAVSWYNDIINEFTKNRLLIIASNHQQNEYFSCSETFDLTPSE